MSTQIASAAEEQSAVAEEINRNLIRINGIGEQSADASRQSSQAASELSGLSPELRTLVGRFKI